MKKFMKISYSYAEERLFGLLKEHDLDKRRLKAQSLWMDVVTTKQQPVTIDNRALFLFHGKAQHVTLVGDWSYWQPNTSLQRIEHTDLFYAIVQFPPDARLQYKMIVDGNWLNDPANYRVQAEGFGYNSEFWMPDYHDISMLEVHHAVQHGTIERVKFESSLLNSHREMFFYFPPKLKSEHEEQASLLPNELPLLVIHDGGEAIRLGKFNVIMDNLISENKIPRVAAVFITPQMRNEEYATNNDYIRFTVEEALPFIISQFEKRGVKISEDRYMRCVTGASLGGLLSTKTVLKYPEAFGSVIAQSPSYWWNKGEIFRMKEMGNAHRIHFVIQTGTICDAKDLASLMATRLRALTAKVDYFEHAQGHTWGNWRTTFSQGIQAWLPKKHSENIVEL